MSKINNWQHVPECVRTAFRKSAYGDAKIDGVECVERHNMTHKLYRLSFRHQWKNVPQVSHEMLLNEDGMILAAGTGIYINNFRWFVTLADGQADYIARHYAGAKIRAYANLASNDTYYILHNDTLKTVTFRSGYDKYSDWYETRYELSIDTQVPQNVMDYLHKEDPDFCYTNIFYVETPNGNAYFLQDRNSKNDLGYNIREDL